MPIIWKISHKFPILPIFFAPCIKFWKERNSPFAPTLNTTLSIEYVLPVRPTSPVGPGGPGGPTSPFRPGKPGVPFT